MIHCNIPQVLTEGYKLEGASAVYRGQIFTGDLAPLDWACFVGGLVAPLILMLVRPGPARPRACSWPPGR